MNRILVAVVAACLVPLGYAVADETHPDCEPGQTDIAAGAPFSACEGEQWDGQDPVNSPVGDGATGADAGGQGATVAVNGYKDPNGQTPSLNPSDVHQFRVSVGYGSDVGVYYTQSQYGVGQQAAWVGADGTVSWWGRDGTDALGVFGPVIGAINDDADEGDADGNLIAYVVGVIGTPGGGFKTGEGDCTQSDFEQGDCERDNTAVTFHILA